MRPEIERLLRQADRDLENARKNLTTQAYEVVAFLAQQAVEKYLKGAWVVTNREPAPHTHALTELGDGLGGPSRSAPSSRGPDPGLHGEPVSRRGQRRAVRA
jgi:HEPN domain-containing protein